MPIKLMPPHHEGNEHLQRAQRLAARARRHDNAGRREDATHCRRHAFAELQHHLLIAQDQPAPACWILERILAATIATEAEKVAA